MLQVKQEANPPAEFTPCSAREFRFQQVFSAQNHSNEFLTIFVPNHQTRQKQKSQKGASAFGAGGAWSSTGPAGRLASAQADGVESSWSHAERKAVGQKPTERVGFERKNKALQLCSFLQ